MKAKSTPCYCQAYNFPHRVGGGECNRRDPLPSDQHEQEPLDPHTGRLAAYECICLWSPHPHCPQHGNELWRRTDIPDYMSRLK